MGHISDNIERVRERMTAAAERAGRNPADVHLIGVSKGFAVDVIHEALGAGIAIIGESRVQEAKDKHSAVTGRAEFHMIGHLQTNKAGQAVKMFDMIQSVDSPRIARALESKAAAAETTQRILVEVNTSGDESKFGVDPSELNILLDELVQCPHLCVEGLMTIGPLGGGEAGARKAFQTLRGLLPKLWSGGLPIADPAHLSMGMTGDFEAAIEEGATLVRVGTAIFGSRHTGRP